MSEVFYKYLLSQWKLHKIDEMYVSAMVDAGRLTQEEADLILSTPR